MTRILSPLLMFALIGCASVLQGPTQEMAFESQPSGAQCDVERGGQFMVAVRTPGLAVIKRSENPLTVVCRLSGHDPVTTIVQAKTAGAFWGNYALCCGAIGMIIDASNDAVYEYPTPIIAVFPK